MFNSITSSPRAYACEVLSQEEHDKWQKNIMLARFFALTNYFKPEKRELNQDTGEFTLYLPSALSGKISRKLGSDGIEMAAGATLSITKIVTGRIDFQAKEIIFIGKKLITVEKSIILPTFSVTKIKINGNSYEFEGSCAFGSGSITYTKNALDVTLQFWQPKAV